MPDPAASALASADRRALPSSQLHFFTCLYYLTSSLHLRFTSSLIHCSSLHFLLGAMAVPRDDVVLELLVLLVLHAQRLSFVVHQFHA